MKRAMLIFGAIWVSILLSGAAVAGIIAGPSCDPSHVTATGPVIAADDCIGLLDKSGSGAGPNDSESFLNNAQSYDGGGGTIWAIGAFGFNDWDFLGKDDQEGGQAFIDVTSGDPATWGVDSALNGSYVIAIKQANLLGLWYFDSLVNVTAGELYINEIFGYAPGDDQWSSDDGWSHVSIYGRETSVPEPASLVLLGMGLVGIGFARRFRTRHNR